MWRPISIVSVVLALSAPASARELIWLQPASAEQVQAACTVLPFAQARDGNRFLVFCEPTQLADLQILGIAYTLVESGTEPEGWMLVGPTHHERTDRWRAAVAVDAVPVGANRVLVRSDDPAVLSLAEQHLVYAQPLDRAEIGITWVDPALGYPGAPLDSFPTDTLAQLVSRDSLYAYTKRLEDFVTRYSYTDSVARACDWIVQKFLSFGYTDVTTQTFPFANGWTGRNIIVVKPGYAEPDQVIVIGGHYDSYCGTTPTIQAPGADDDATGVAVTLECARILANMPLRKTVIFMPFGGEEQWMVGSYYGARQFALAGTQIEMMYNYDMVAYTPFEQFRLELSSAPGVAYRDLLANQAQHLTAIQPFLVEQYQASDQRAFIDNGFEGSMAIEHDFNSPNYHKTSDLCVNLNFDYLRDVTRMAVTALAATANAGRAFAIEKLMDMGDGQRLKVVFAAPDQNYTYKLFWSWSTGDMLDSMDVPFGQYEVIIPGLDESRTYRFYAYGTPQGSYRSISAKPVSLAPLQTPRAPTALTSSGSLPITLDWPDNVEADLHHYNLYRRVSGGSWALMANDLVTSEYVESSIANDLTYEYTVTAVDLDGNESGRSPVATACIPTFSHGIVLVDESIRQYLVLPDEEGQVLYFDSLMNGPYHLVRVEPLPARIDRCSVGPYSSLFYVDDDISDKMLSYQNDRLAWYMEQATNVCLYGYRTVKYWTTSPVAENHLLRTEFGVLSYTYPEGESFQAARGEPGWPDLVFEPTDAVPFLYPVPAFEHTPNATVIYRMDTPQDLPDFEGKPCGLLVDTPKGKRVVLSFPLYFMNHDAARAFIQKVKEVFGEIEPDTGPGDIDGSGLIDIGDLNWLVAYLSDRNMSPMPNHNGADCSGDCFVDLADLSYMVSFLMSGQPELLPGCVAP